MSGINARIRVVLEYALLPIHIRVFCQTQESAVANRVWEQVWLRVQEQVFVQVQVRVWDRVFEEINS
jgi:hypothetical protein